MSRTVAWSSGWTLAHGFGVLTPAATDIEHGVDRPERSSDPATRRAICDPMAAMAAPNRAVSSGVRGAVLQPLPAEPRFEVLAPALVHRVDVLEERPESGAVDTEVGPKTRREPVAGSVGLDDALGAQRADDFAGGEGVETEFGGDLLRGESAVGDRVEHAGSAGNGDHPLRGEVPQQSLQSVEIEFMTHDSSRGSASPGGGCKTLPSVFLILPS